MRRLSMLLPLLWCLCVVTANLESLVFRAPSIINGSPLNESIRVLSIGEPEVALTLPSPDSNEALEQLFILNGIPPSTFNFVRLTWSSLDPIDIKTFELIEEEHNGIFSLLLRLKTRYNCFSSDPEFMSTPHDIKILISITNLSWLTDPSKILSAFPRITMYFLGALVSFQVVYMTSGALYAYLY